MTALVKEHEHRNWFGISYLYDDAILYMAGTQVDPQKERSPPGCTEYTLKKGNYISIYRKDFANDPSAISNAFETLLAQPGIDETGCCAECYLPEGTHPTNAINVRCMVRLADNR